MIKQDLRKKYKALRRALSASQIDSYSLSIANRTLELPIWNKGYYHVFLSIREQHEVDTEFLLHILQGKDKNIVISKSNFEDSSMSHYLLTDATSIKKNQWNIPEPLDGIPISTSSIEVVFVPLLAFDKSGHRVGYGKGFYDVFLRDCHPNTIKIGLSFFEAEQEISDLSKSDIALNYCVTPSQVYPF